MKSIRLHLKLVPLIVVLVMLTGHAMAQICDYSNRLGVILKDGTSVTLFGRASNTKVDGTESFGFTGDYYYLPVNMRLSKKTDGTPEFLLMKYTTDETADAGGVQGALMHFLMEWGLTPAQESELNEKVKMKVRELAEGNPLFANITGKVMGPIDLTATQDNSFRIISAVMTDATMTPKLVTSGKAPVMEGAKVAVAAKLDKNGAQLLAATLEKTSSISDVSLEMSFKYNLLFPAVRGKITVDWSKFQVAYESVSASFAHDSHDKGDEDDTYSYDEVQRIYSAAIERKAVVIEIDKNTTDDALANKVVEEFMNVFLSSLADNADQNERLQPATAAEKEKNPDIQHGKSYRFNKTKFESHSERKIEVYNLLYRLNIPKEVVVTENLSSWYDGVRDNKKCVSSVNLNDPFFEHRAINFILSEGVEHLLGPVVDLVNVNVRKKRNDGTTFTKSTTIDKDYLKKNGIRTGFTYARDNDNNNEVYEYQVQWSFNGGGKFPNPAPWIAGEWEGVALTLPVEPHTIELECTPDDLKAAGITRASLQIRYMKLGKEVESMIPLTVSKNENLVSKMIFVDPNSRGYAYRIVYNHREAGKLATEWDAKINDDYVYATIPDEYKDKTSDLFKKAIELGKEFTESPDGKVTKASEVLDKFKTVLGIVTN